MPSVNQLSITLPADMVQVIRAKVADGAYANDSDLVREAVRGWIEREHHFAALSEAVDRGITDADADRVASSDDVRAGLLARLGPEGASHPR